MKQLLRIFSILFVCAMLAAMFPVASSANSANGWKLDSDGIQRYYKNGEFVTGACDINGFPYEFDSNGACLGVYDTHTGVGTLGLSDSNEYKNALKALGAENIIGYYPMTQGESYKSASYTKNNLWGLGKFNPDPTKAQFNTSIYTKNDIYTSVSGKSYFVAIQRYSSAELFERESGNTAFTVNGPSMNGGSSLHNYISMITQNTKSGEDTVIEGEYKLDRNFKGAGPFLQLIDRKNTDTGADAFHSVLNINNEGGVYLSNDKNALLCVINRNDYTRLSVTLHQASNTLDIHVNGVLVRSGVEYISETAAYTSKNFQIDEVRLTQISSLESGCMYIDNLAMYRASAPVCTVTEEPKNGLYLEGGVLRYYENNLIAIGSRMVSGEFCGIKYEDERVNFGTVSGNGGAEIGAKATVKVNGAVKSSSRIAGNLFTAPASVSPENGKFGGWSITDGNSKVILAPGQSYRMSGDIVCEPLTVGFSMLDGASVRTTEGSTGIRFMAKLDKTDYAALKQNGVTVTPHILIAPTEYYLKTYGYYTVDALRQAGYSDFIDITVDSWYSESERSYYFAGSVANILPENYAIEYSGIAYLEITYPNGSTVLVYSDYDESVNSRSVYRIAHAAYNDRTTLENISSYPNPVKYNGINTYSPYDEAKREIIKGFADRVVMLKSDKDNVKIAGDFYDAPYTVENVFNTQTLETDVTVIPAAGYSTSDIYGIEFDGIPLSKTDYTVSDTCSFSVDIGGVDYSSLKCNEDDENNSWLFMDSTYDWNFYNRTEPNRDSDYCIEGATDSLKWSFDRGLTADNSAAASKRTGAYHAKYNTADGCYYYDLSDFVSLRFSIYSNKSSTLQFLIYSENPLTDGIDYYSAALKMNAGWNNFTINKKSMGSSRSPLGWNKITAVTLSASGWEQTNTTDTVLYISDIVAYDKEQKNNAFDLPELGEAAVFSVGGYYSAVNGKKYMTSENDMNATALLRDGIYYIPMSPLASSVEMSGKYYPSSDTLYADRDGVSYVYRVGERKYTVGNETKELMYAPIESGDAILFSVQDMAEAFGYSQVYTDRMGLIVLSNTPNIYDSAADSNKIYTLIEECIYVRPTGDRIIADFMNASGGAHPYIMINNEGFEKLRYYYIMDATFRQYFNNLEKSYSPTSNNFKAATTDYLLTDGRRLTRGVKDKTIYWAFFAKFYETVNPELSAQYAERCWIEVESGCNFFDGKVKSWNPDHYLDTAEMSYPIAIAYDWLYDYWVKTNSNIKTEYNADNTKTAKNYDYNGTETRLSIMEDAMYWLGLATTSALSSDDTGKYINYGYNLAGPTNNWNAVCTGGNMAAALAIAGVDRYAENVKSYLEYSVDAIESGMWVYGPDGGYEEGPGYWTYGTTYLHVFLSAIDTACGTNYGIYNAPGFAHSVYFTTYLGTKNTTWGFHDGGSGSADTSIAPWFAIKAQDGNVNAIRRQAIENGWKGSSFYDILYYDPHLCSDTITLDTDAYYSLDDIMTFRTGWNADNCVFAGLHGGDNTASHGDLDIGNFIINVDGTYMICDLGADAYNIDGYFGSHRWGYYRKRAEGQNTIVMLPHGKSWNGTTGNPQNSVKPVPDQIYNAISKTVSFESGESTAFGVVNMAPAYTQMTEGIRGLYMEKSTNTVIIQDEAKFSQAMDIWWFAHTEGRITVSPDGRSAIIERNGVYLYAEIITDASHSAKFTSMKANSLDANYVGDTDTSDEYIKDNVEKSRDSFTKLCVELKNVTELRLAIAFTVIPSADALPTHGSIYQWKRISDWKAE